MVAKIPTPNYACGWNIKSIHKTIRPNNTFICKHNSRAHNNTWIPLHNLYLWLTKRCLRLWSVNSTSFLCNIYEPFRNFGSIYPSICLHPSFSNIHWDGKRRTRWGWTSLICRRIFLFCRRKNLFYRRLILILFRRVFFMYVCNFYCSSVVLWSKT